MTVDYQIIEEELYYDVLDCASDEVRDMLYDNAKKLSDIECGWLVTAIDCVLERCAQIDDVKIRRVLDIFIELRELFKTLEGKEC